MGHHSKDEYMGHADSTAEQSDTGYVEMEAWLNMQQSIIHSFKKNCVIPHLISIAMKTFYTMNLGCLTFG